jgi:hypothetical protein
MNHEGDRREYEGIHRRGAHRVTATRVRAVERRAWVLQQPEGDSAKSYLFELDEAIAGVDRSIANLSGCLHS